LPIGWPNVWRWFAYDTRIERRPSQPDRASGHRKSALVDRTHRDLEPFAVFADPVLDRHAHIIERQFAGVTGPHAELCP
jgi:hypothetical protein